MYSIAKSNKHIGSVSIPQRKIQKAISRVRIFMTEWENVQRRTEHPLKHIKWSV